jgi:hypothetical protein
VWRYWAETFRKEGQNFVARGNGGLDQVGHEDATALRRLMRKASGANPSCYRTTQMVGSK